MARGPLRSVLDAEVKRPSGSDGGEMEGRKELLSAGSARFDLLFLSCRLGLWIPRSW